jgi:hypothetical protein
MMAQKTSPNGTLYEITNWWDEVAFQLICAWQTTTGAVKGVVSDVVSTVTEPVSKGLKDVGKGLTSWIPILLVVAAIAAGVYFFVIKGKVRK